MTDDPRDADLMRQELNAISAAIGTVRFMDPPDGGDVSLAEQVTRMREALDKAEAWSRLQAQDIVTLGHLAGQTLDAQAENEKLRAALKPFAAYADPSRRISPHLVLTKGSGLARRQLTMGDCYAALAALATQPSKTETRE